MELCDFLPAWSKSAVYMPRKTTAVTINCEHGVDKESEKDELLRPGYRVRLENSIPRMSLLRAYLGRAGKGPCCAKTFVSWLSPAMSLPYHDRLPQLSFGFALRHTLLEAGHASVT
jgi:hypothetical protein